MKHTGVNWFRGFVAVILLPALIYVVTQLRSCAPATQQPAYSQVVATEVKTIYDTVFHETVRERLVPDSSFVVITAEIDTAAILASYLQTHVYNDTIADSTLLAVQNFTISQNLLAGYKFSYKLLKPVQTIITTTVMPEPKHRSYWLGINAGFSAGTGRLGFGPQLLFTQDARAYGIGYDVVGKTVTANFLIKL